MLLNAFNLGCSSYILKGTWKKISSVIPDGNEKNEKKNVSFVFVENEKNE